MSMHGYLCLPAVVQAYNDAADSMARLNRTAAKLMHKHGKTVLAADCDCVNQPCFTL